MNKKFTDPKADVRAFVKQWENDARDVYAKRREVVRAVGLRQGDSVADIGAGTGLFTLLFAAQVGQKGVVYAVDISPAFVTYIAEQARLHGFERVVKTVLNTPDSAELPRNSIDVAFLCNTYHHFQRPEKMLASIHRALRPGGRLVVIDFDLRKDSGEFIRKRARAPKQVYFREIAAAGFEPIQAKDAPAIKDNFFAEFRRVEGPRAAPAKHVAARADGLALCQSSIDGWHALKGRGEPPNHALSGRATLRSNHSGASGRLPAPSRRVLGCRPVFDSCPAVGPVIT